MEKFKLFLDKTKELLKDGVHKIKAKMGDMKPKFKSAWTKARTVLSKAKLPEVNKAFFKTKYGIICIAAAAVLLLAAAGVGGYGIWRYNQPKFHDVTVELGVDSVKLSQFMTEYARARKVSFVSDVSAVDLNHTGVTELTLAHGRKQETVTLTVQDTIAPRANFVKEMTVTADYEFKIEDFVTEVKDFSDSTVAFANQPVIPDDYSDLAVKLVVSDEYGNKLRGKCTVSFVWLKESFALEYGDEIEKADLLFNPEKDSPRVKQAELNVINEGGIGTYTVKSKAGGKTLYCEVTVQDTKGPEIVLQEVKLPVGGTAKFEDFLVSCEDISGVTSVGYVSEPDFTLNGKQVVSVKATDIYGNESVKDMILWISDDYTPPYFTGLDTLYPEKYVTPDYAYGVTAYDDKDGELEFTFDASNVNLDVAGTYYVTYTAQDLSGNIYSEKRKVEVPHDQADIDAMVKEIAADLSDDPEYLRQYVMNSIYYSSSWGDNDPVWYGFTNRSGNCYVHALCLKALYEEKGYECQLIWSECKSHYWLIVKIDGVWWHSDATPGPVAGYGLMNDVDRDATLNGRVWDRDAWPACGN